MGRPLRKDRLAKMNLSATKEDGSSVVLGKQVGYNKYVYGDESERNIVRLTDKYVTDIDGVLQISVKGVNQPVLKITKKLFYTASGVYAYELTDNGVVFVDETITIVDPATPTPTNIDGGDAATEPTSTLDGGDAATEPTDM